MQEKRKLGLGEAVMSRVAESSSERRFWKETRRSFIVVDAVYQHYHRDHHITTPTTMVFIFITCGPQMPLYHLLYSSSPIQEAFPSFARWGWSRLPQSLSFPSPHFFPVLCVTIIGKHFCFPSIEFNLQRRDCGPGSLSVHSC